MLGGMLMNRRVDRQSVSRDDLHLSFTLEDEERIKGLAYYLSVPYSQLLRGLAREKRQALYDEGKRPPLKPRFEQHSGTTGPRGDGKTRKYRSVRVTSEEKEEIVALAQYLGLPYGQMLVELCEGKREALYKEGRRPPLKPPENAWLVSDVEMGRKSPPLKTPETTGKKAPRKKARDV